MLKQVDDLDSSNFGWKKAMKGPEWERKEHALRDSGARIRQRLHDLVDQYDEYIRECTHVMEGMTLVT